MTSLWPDAARQPRTRTLAVALAGAAAVLAAVSVVYAGAASSYFFNDDFHWFQDARRFEASNLLRLDRYSHFYRPVIEIYFYVGQALFGCRALPFHLVSIGVHLVNTLVLFLFAQTLTGRAAFAFLAAALFSVQPGHVEAVAWVGAITDLLPALWYFLALWMHLLFLQGRGARFYVLSALAFATCLLTHESSATLLAMMMALEATLVLEGGTRLARETWKRRAVRYAPFAAMLAGYLAVAYVVNSRSYLVAEGHYRFGWHAVPNILNYIVSLVVWRRGPPAYLVITAAIVALLARGSPRARFFTLWIVATMGPASFFTWGNVSRYLYIPAAGFALLLADLTLRGGDLAARRIPPRAARALTLFVACALAVRFAVFAREAADDFRERTRPYERLVEAVRTANPAPSPDGVVYVDRAIADTVPAVYLEPAVQAAYCTADVRAVVR